MKNKLFLSVVALLTIGFVACSKPSGEKFGDIYSIETDVNAISVTYTNDEFENSFYFTNEKSIENIITWIENIEISEDDMQETLENANENTKDNFFIHIKMNTNSNDIVHVTYMNAGAYILNYNNAIETIAYENKFCEELKALTSSTFYTGDEIEKISNLNN